MLELARRNQIKDTTYFSRIRRGMSKREAATKPLKKYTGEIAVYKGDEILAIGTAEECAEQLGVTTEYIRWLITPYGKKRAASRKDPNKATTAVKLD